MKIENNKTVKSNTLNLLDDKVDRQIRRNIKRRDLKDTTADELSTAANFCSNDKIEVG